MGEVNFLTHIILHLIRAVVVLAVTVVVAVALGTVEVETAHVA